MDEIHVAFYSYVADVSGYGHTARAWVHALHRAGVQLSVVDLARRRTRPPDELTASLTGRRVDAADVHLFYGIPTHWARLAFPLRNAVGATVWETDTVPSQWRSALNHVQEVWLPCAFNAGVFERALERPVFHLPYPVFPPRISGDVPEPDAFLRVEPDEFVFYALFEWQDRKGAREAVEAFLRAFGERDRAVLVLKTNAAAADEAARAVADARARHASGARIEVRAESWSDAEVEALYRRGDCYVSLHRGEGWGYPLFDAAVRGTPVVATGYSGPLDFLSPEHHALVRHTLAPVRQPYVYYAPTMRWAEPDVEHAAELMRRVHDHRAEAREKAAAGAARLLEAFSMESVGRRARARLEEVRERVRPRRVPLVAAAVRHTPTYAAASAAATLPRTAPSRAVAVPSIVVAAKPVEPVPPGGPVPAEWYDEDYFETGRKTGWSRGYGWALFGGLFREMAGMLAETIPGAGSYLDAGCAKGLLVRALRDLGKDAWGFDASRWALDHAEPAARPYLTRASVEDVALKRDYDVLSATDLFQTLTEAQLDAFLPRARKHTSTALFAVIPSFDTDGDEAAYRPGPLDASHVTMRTRAWWHAKLLAAGWKQDNLHRAVQDAFARHALVRRIGWKVYVYAP